MTQFITDDLFYYNKQIRSYILQFMAVFSALKVQVGKRDDREESLIPVHITYGAKDRVVASIFSDNTQNKPLRLPAMSAYLSNIDQAPDLRKGTGLERRETYLPQGGTYPDEITTVRQRMPVPYRANMDLSIYASNREQHLQIMEQILMFFDPIVQIQKSDDSFDWTKITTIELIGINFEENYPAGADRRIIQSTLNFQMPFWLSAPATLKQDFIRDINLRIGEITADTITSADVIEEFDEAGLNYQAVFQLDDTEIPE